MTFADGVFYLLFAGQVVLLSYYFPGKIAQRMAHVLATYPASEYPKLYPKAPEVYRIGLWLFKATNRIIMAIGALLLLALVFVVDHQRFADDGFISEAWPAGYGMLQFLPFVVLSVSEAGQFKLMRQQNRSTTRRAELRPRRLFDFVSPVLFWLAVFMFVGAFVFDLWAHGLDFSITHDAMQRGLIMAGMWLFMIGVGAWQLYGRKQNPHQSFEDRSRQIRVSLQSMLLVSIALCVLIASKAANDVWHLDFLDAIVMSLYFQAIAAVTFGLILRHLRVEDIDFDVYKSESAVT